jgi:radical SAM superfamily enzyme
MAPAVSGAGLDFLKLHHLHLVRHTALAVQHLNQPFRLLECGEYIDLVVRFLELLDPAIRMERMFAVAPEELLIAPRWGKSKAEIQRAIELELERRGTWQGRLNAGEG